MAASGFTPISLYYSTTASAVPTSGNLANGELGLNIADMKLYAKNSAGTVTLLASNAGASGSVTSVSGTGTVNGLTLTGTVTTSGSLTLGGTLSGTASININGTVGATTPTTGAFTTLSASASGEALTIGSNSLAGNTAQYFRNTSGYSGLALTSAADQYLTGSVAGDLAIGTNAKSLRFGNLGSGSLGATLDASGNFGIGTATPSSFGKFAVLGTGAFITNSVLRFYNSGNTNWSVIDNPATDGTAPLRFQTGAGEVARFINSGALSFGSSGTAYGSSGQVLTSAGAGGVPTWETPAGGGSQAFVAFGSTGGL